MSSIPPAGHAGLIQAHGAQNRAADVKQKENAEQAKRTSKDTFSRELQEVIEASDKDTEVFADAEGSGSQGKSHSEEEEQPEERSEQADADGQPGGGLDVEA